LLGRIEKGANKPAGKFRLPTVSLIFLFFGIFFLLPGGYNIFYGYSSKNWPSTPGEIVRSEWGSRGETIVYIYTINGVDYRSHSVDFGFIRHSKTLLGLYPVGAEVLVYYDPKNPSRAVLEPGISLQTSLVTSMGIICLCLTILFVLSGFLPGKSPSINQSQNGGILKAVEAHYNETTTIQNDESWLQKEVGKPILILVVGIIILLSVVLSFLGVYYSF
jgi:hypothetical protein